MSRRTGGTRRARATGVVLLLLASATAARAATFRVEARLEPPVVGLGERVRFTLRVEGPGLDQPRLRPRFELDNLELVAGPDPSHGISMGNRPGDAGWMYSWTWWLKPRSVGPAVVHNIALLVGDREIGLAPRRIEVVREPPPRRQGNAGPPPRTPLEELMERTRERLWRGLRPPEEEDPRPDVLLRAVATPTRPYVGQRVVYTVFLLARVPVNLVDAESMPTFQGLWARQVDLQPSRGEPVEWQGAYYNRLPVFRKELFALAPRHHTLEPVRARVIVDRIEQDRMFLAPVHVPEQLVAESNPVELDVRPLPPVEGTGGRGFTGAVGRLGVVAELAPRTVAVGQGATLTLTVAGDGHLEALPPPEVAVPAGVDLIGPQPAAAPDGEERARCWHYLLVPRRPGTFHLPAVELPYFDPEAGEYRVASTQPQELVARPATEADREASAPPRPIRSAALPAPAEALWRTTLPWAFALPWTAALVLVLVRRRPSGCFGAAGADDLSCFRGRLCAALREERPRPAAVAIARAWRELLAKAAGVPEGIPEASWPDVLLERGAAPDACRALRELLDDLHYLRFAPELSATSALAGELVERSERLARELLLRR